MPRALSLELALLVIGAGCAHERTGPAPAPYAIAFPTPGRGPLEPPSWALPDVARTGERNRCVDRELVARGQAPIAAERAPDDRAPLDLHGSADDAYARALREQPGIAIVCSRAPGERDL